MERTKQTREGQPPTPFTNELIISPTRVCLAFRGPFERNRRQPEFSYFSGYTVEFELCEPWRSFTHAAPSSLLCLGGQLPQHPDHIYDRCVKPNYFQRFSMDAHDTPIFGLLARTILLHIKTRRQKDRETLPICQASFKGDDEGKPPQHRDVNTILLPTVQTIQM